LTGRNILRTREEQRARSYSETEEFYCFHIYINSFRR
jgi:hypothetical protein